MEILEQIYEWIKWASSLCYDNGGQPEKRASYVQADGIVLFDYGEDIFIIN